MERPNIRDDIGHGKGFFLVARTQSSEEAERIAEQYRMQGFETRIVKKTQGALSLFEVWASKEPEIFS